MMFVTFPLPRTGWSALSSDEYDAAWSQFQAKFSFRPSVDAEEWPGIREPRPSMTFDLSGPAGVERSELFAAVNTEAMQSFGMLSDVPELLVLDWQHEAWRLDVATELSNPEPDDPINGYPTVYPDGDYYSFLNPFHE